MQNRVKINFCQNDDREWVYLFQTWDLKCPKTCEDFDNDHEKFIEWAYSRVYREPHKYMVEYLTQEEGREERPPLPDYLAPFEIRKKIVRKSVLTHSQFEAMTDS